MFHLSKYPESILKLLLYSKVMIVFCLTQNVSMCVLRSLRLNCLIIVEQKKKLLSTRKSKKVEEIKIALYLCLAVRTEYLMS